MDMDEETLDIQKCCVILDIDFTKLTNLSHDYIKKKYHKMALKWHPDKNPNLDQKFVNSKFQEINEAYEYLCKELENETFISLDSQIYINLLTFFISNIINGNYKELIITILKELILTGKEYSFSSKFDILDKENMLEIYRFLCKYKDILHIKSDIIDFVSSQIKEKYKDNKIYILNPSITDIINNNIYKLYVDDKLYLVPLWHNELYFDNPIDKDNDIIVLCLPDLPENIIIDENNNINYELTIDFNKEDLLFKKYIEFSISNKYFKIPIEKLCIKKEQYYTLKNQGISRLIENDIYNIQYKDDIIVKIIFN